MANDHLPEEPDSGAYRTVSDDAVGSSEDRADDACQQPRCGPTAPTKFCPIIQMDSSGGRGITASVYRKGIRSDKLPITF
jgi:hypothetical protein